MCTEQTKVFFGFGKYIFLPWWNRYIIWRVIWKTLLQEVTTATKRNWLFTHCARSAHSIYPVLFYHWLNATLMSVSFFSRVPFPCRKSSHDRIFKRRSWTNSIYLTVLYMDITKYYHVILSCVSFMSFYKMQVKLNNFYPNVGFSVLKDFDSDSFPARKTTKNFPIVKSQIYCSKRLMINASKNFRQT